MDIREIKKLAIDLRAALSKKGYIADGIILFGSYAEGRARPESDIDLAVISRDFGRDRLKEGSLLNLVGSQIDYRIEAIPVSLSEYLDKGSISPVLHEVKTKGTFLV